MRTYIRLGSFAVIAAGLFAASALGAAARKPNIVFLLVDNLGYMDIGANNPASFYETPNIDRLADGGTRFTHGYAACQVCSPTRASILTGKYPARIGITDFIGAAQPEKWTRNTRVVPSRYKAQLELKEATLAELLKGAGYATFFAGKWHLGGQPYWPEHQGFDVNRGGHSAGGPYGGKKYFSPYGNPRLSDGPDGEHLPARLAAETAQFIEKNRARPFFALLSFYSVHTPLMAPPDLVEKYRAKRTRLGIQDTWGQEGTRKVRLTQSHDVYAGMVAAMDRAVGAVLDALERVELQENTIVIFTSDNGGLSTSEGHPTANVPYRAGKGWVYEGGIRVPVVVRWPGHTVPGSVNETVLTSPDWVPSLLAATGIDVPAGGRWDGVSLARAFKGEHIERGPVFWHYPHYGNQGGFPAGAVRHGDWKLIENYEDGSLHLFNLRADPGEQQDLNTRHPNVARELHTRLVAWREGIGALMPTPNARFDAAKPESR